MNTRTTWILLSLTLIAAFCLQCSKESIEDHNVNATIKNPPDPPDSLFGQFGDPVIPEDGFYVVGPAAFFENLTAENRMWNTRNETANGSYNDGSIPDDEFPLLMETYLYMEAGTIGFQFIRVESGIISTWGSNGLVNEIENGQDQPMNTVLQGQLTQSTDMQLINVQSSGLHHLSADFESGVFALSPVSHFSVIGQAVGGWAFDNEMEVVFSSPFMSRYRIDSLQFLTGEYKIRYGNGWKVILDDDQMGTLSNGIDYFGIRVNANYGGSLTDLVPGGPNIFNSNEAYYDVELTITPGNGPVAQWTYVAGIPPEDFSQTTLGLIGDGLVGSTWDLNVGHTLPEALGDYVFKYDFGVHTVNASGSFKIRENFDNWTGFILGYNNITFTGDGAGDFVPIGGYNDNIGPTVDGATYSFVLYWDSQNDTRTLEVTIQ